MTTTTQAPIIRGADEGEKRWFYGGALLTWKASSTETNGAFSLWEASMVRGKVHRCTPTSPTKRCTCSGRDPDAHGRSGVPGRGGRTCRTWWRCRTRSWCSEWRASSPSKHRSCEGSRGASEPGADGSGPVDSDRISRRPPRAAGSKSSDRLHSLSLEPCKNCGVTAISWLARPSTRPSPDLSSGTISSP